MKMIKSKVAIGVVTAGLLISGGVAFASSNAGTLLTNWANTKSDNAKKEVETSYNTKYGTDVAVMTSNVNAYKVGAANNIEAVGTSQTNLANTQINAALQEHLTAISNALTALNMSVPGDFATYVTKTNGDTTTNLNNLKDSLNSSFNVQLSAVAKGADGKLQSDLGASRSDAVNKLMAKIQEAKQSIESLISTQQSAAQTAVLDHLASEIDRIETALKLEIDTKKAEAIGTLEATQTKATTDAKGEMQALVDAINK